ncbi:MAG: hypothetical protein QNK40_08795 [Desulfobacterales bacterium]|nr:hypothetical protein [Desulfobacterales bacterium]MDX2509242.1 hypothetical protein [Desulfobacterales bacterium]
MKNRIYIIVFFLAALWWTILSSDPAFATCDYGRPEGVHTHQLAHIFFIISMGILIYRLREKKPHLPPGWKFIQYSAIFFILWGLDAFAVHFMDEQFNIIQIELIGLWQIKLNDCFDCNLLKFFYYLARMDYLLCMPAFIFLYYGLRNLLKESPLDVSVPDVSETRQV